MILAKLIATLAIRQIAAMVRVIARNPCTPLWIASIMLPTVVLPVLPRQ